jgi:hypothetical protein
VESDWNVLRVQFEPPHKGIGLIRVRFGERQIERSFSYSPADTISEPAEAVDAVVAAGGKRTVVFHGGPDELEFSFDRRDEADGVSLTVTAFESRSRDRGGDEFLRVRTFPQLLGKLFWRALGELEGAISPQDYVAEWRHPFPHRIVAQLGERLN